LCRVQVPSAPAHVLVLRVVRAVTVIVVTRGGAVMRMCHGG
jgi:hypothetical protein